MTSYYKFSRPSKRFSTFFLIFYIKYFWRLHGFEPPTPRLKVSHQPAAPLTSTFLLIISNVYMKYHNSDLRFFRNFKRLYTLRYPPVPPNSNAYPPKKLFRIFWRFYIFSSFSSFGCTEPKNRNFCPKFTYRPTKITIFSQLKASHTSILLFIR